MYLVNISIQSWGVLKGTLKIQKNEKQTAQETRTHERWGRDIIKSQDMINSGTY